MGVGCCHEVWILCERWCFEFAHCEETECVTKFCSANLNSQIDGGDEMFWWQRTAVLSDDFHGRFARDKKDETGRFLLGISFA